MTKQERVEQKADRLYKFVHDHLKEHARAPSYREMDAHLGCSSKTVQKLLDHLEQSGRGLHRVKGCWRRIWVPVNDTAPKGE